MAKKWQKEYRRIAKAEADRLFAQGMQQYNNSQFKEALQSWQQSLSRYREIRDRKGEGYSLGSLGNAYNRLGEYQQAINYLILSVEITQKIGDRNGEGHSLGNLGNVYDSLGDYQRAIDYYQQSLRIAKEIGDHHGEANSLVSLGNAYNSLGKYQKAIDSYQQSLSITRAMGDHHIKGALLNSLGKAYDFLGEYQRAIDYYQQSLRISLKIDDRYLQSNAISNLGNVYDSLGEYHKAIYYHQQSLAIAQKIGDRYGEGSFLNNLGNAYNSLREYHKAIDYCLQSLAIAQEIGDRYGESHSLGDLGNAYNCLGEYQRAIDYYQQSLAITQKIGDRRGEWLSLNNLGAVFLKNNQLAQAEKQLYAALKMCESLRYNLVNSNYKISIFENQLRTYRLLQEVLVAQAKYDIALDIAERGRTRTFVELLRQCLSTPEKVIEIANQEIKPESKPLTQIAQVQNATIVEYSIVFDDIYIWVISATGKITFRRANLKPLKAQNKTLKDLKDIILKARVSIGVDERDEQGTKIQCEDENKLNISGRYPLLHLLYQILISPIADLLPQNPDTPLIIIPHYSLFLVPFPALQDFNNHYLIEHHTLLTAPSLEILDLTHQRQQSLSHINQPPLVVGDPKIHPKFTQNPYNLKPIPAAKAVAESIATLLQTQAITGEEATKARILNQMSHASLIHISAHGLLDDFHDSGIPGTIILAPGNTDNGALNATEILTLTLNTQLVVLSACSTGRGKITSDGIIGLSRCFILAGTPSLIVSLWNMGAKSATTVMTEFYQNLAQGTDKATALRKAMLKTKELFPRPDDWAVFTLIGETAPLSLSTQTLEQRKRTMAFASETTPTETIDAFFNLLETSDLFSDHVSSLDQLSAQSTDTPQDIAQRIEQWCESRPTIKMNMENELSQMGAGGTDSQPDAEIAAEFHQRLEKNILRLSSPPSSSTNQTKK